MNNILVLIIQLRKHFFFCDLGVQLKLALFISASIFRNLAVILLSTKLHCCALAVFFFFECSFFGRLCPAFLAFIDRRILRNWSFLNRRSLLAILIDDGACPRLQSKKGSSLTWHKVRPNSEHTL